MKHITLNVYWGSNQYNTYYNSVMHIICINYYALSKMKKKRLMCFNFVELSNEVYAIFAILQVRGVIWKSKKNIDG